MTDPSSRLARLMGYLELDPGNLMLRLDAIREAFATGQWDAARQLLDAGLDACPDQPQLLALSGFSHMQARRFSDAEKALQGALDAGVNSPELRHDLAFAMFLQRRYADALEQLSVQPASAGPPFGLVLRARCLHHLRRPGEAISTLKSHLGDAPKDAEAHGLLALLLQEEGDLEQARAHVEAALERNPRQIEALLTLASLQTDAQETGAARESLDAVISIDPRCGRAWLGRALLNLLELRLNDAKRDIDTAATHMPEHLGTWHVLAWTNLMSGDVAAAKAAFEKAMTVDRTFGETHGGLAVVAALQGHDEEARQHHRRAARLDPQSLAAKYAEMLLLQRDERHDEAKALLESLLSRSAGRGGLQYRELVVAQLRALQARAGHEQPIVYH